MNKGSYKELESEMNANPEFLGLFREEIINSKIKNIGDINLTETEKTDKNEKTEKTENTKVEKKNSNKKNSKQENKFSDQVTNLNLDDHEIYKLKSFIKYFLNINK